MEVNMIIFFSQNIGAKMRIFSSDGIDITGKLEAVGEKSIKIAGVDIELNAIISYGKVSDDSSSY